MDGNDDASPPWAELPADSLSEIAGHLRESGDFVRFHAVCRPWREAPPPHTPSIFLPCLIAHFLYDEQLRLHSPFSVGKHRHNKLTLLTLTALLGKTLECSDACSNRVLAIRQDRTMLMNPLTGDATSLPALPGFLYPMYEWPRRLTGTTSNGIVILFHTSSRRMHRPMAIALLRPGETGWEEVDVTTFLDVNDTKDLDQPTRRALTLCSAGVLRGGRSAMAKLPRAKLMTHRYVVESQGELMCFDVLFTPANQEANAPALISVAVHVLEVGEDGGPRWVKREHGRGIEHLCFFLNRVNNSGFSIDAREFTGTEVSGGCAYFVEDHPKTTEMRSLMDDAVYRYNFKDGTATVVDVLPDGFYGMASMWYMPRPTISAVRS